MSKIELAMKEEGYGTIASDGTIQNLDNFRREQQNPYWQKGLLLHWEDFFKSKDKFAFSPIPNNILSVEGLALTLMLFKLIKDKPEIFQRIALQYLKSVESILNGVVQHNKTSPIAAVHGTTVFASVAHRLGLIDDGGYAKIVDESRNIITVLQQQATAGLALPMIETLVEGPIVQGLSGLTDIGLSKLANTKSLKG